MIKHIALDDHQLLTAPDRDGERFAIFYRRYLPDVVSFVLRRVADRDLSADLTAEVFAAALQARSTFDPRRGDARGWLCAIASNKIVDSHRRGQVDDTCRRRLGMSPIALEDGDLRRVDEIAAARDAVGDSSQLLAGLPADMRAAVAARFAPASAERVRIEADGQTAREFATHPTGNPQGTFFFASLPENPDKLHRLRVVALDADGQPIASINSP